jgi:rhodanese-related sulfurtransferase
MRSFLRELLGGGALMIVAAIVGVAVNAARPDGIALIQDGAPVATAAGVQAPAIDADSAVGGAEAALPEGAVSLAQVKSAFDTGSAVIVDARSASDYQEGHIPGAINIPHDRIAEFVETLNNEISMDAEVICYCHGPDCDFSDLLATELKVMGYQKVSVFTGGWEHWTGAGYPAETGAQ